MKLNDLQQIDELDRDALDRTVGGTDALRLLASVAHKQAEFGTDDLEAVAAKQELKKSMVKYFRF